MSKSKYSADDYFLGGFHESVEEKEESGMIKRKKSCKNDNSLEICQICKQNISDPKTKYFQGLPDGAVEEEVALTDTRLQLYCDGELIPEIDSKPQHKVTCFTVFDGEGHLCPFDTGLIEKDKLIFFSGYIKPIYDDDPSPNNGVPAQELGPIVEWWISGFDCGNSFLLAFMTPYAEYILMEPSPEYSPFMRIPKQKALLTKIVIEFLSNSNKPHYDDLLNRINEVSVPDDIEPFDEHSLRRHAQFIIDQVREVDHKKKLISTPAVQDMISMFEVNVRKTFCNFRRNVHLKNGIRPTTTPLVHRHFEFFFNGSKMADSKCFEKGENMASPWILKKMSKFSWEENSDFAVVNGEVISVKDFVFICTGRGVQVENQIFRIEYFFQRNFTKQVHCTELTRSFETVLGNSGNPNEFFFLEECSDWPICKIIKKVNVIYRRPPKKWLEFIDHQPDLFEDVFFVRKKYSREHGVIEDVKEVEDKVCGVCVRKKEAEKLNVPFLGNGKTDASGITTYDSVKWKNEEYSPGCCIYLEPFSVVFNAQKSSLRIEKTLVTIKTDELIYPEVYRKAKEVSLIEECPEPFVIAYVKRIFTRNEGLQKRLFLTVNKFYRPENTRIIELPDKRLLDLQLLYWSEEEAEVSFDHVRGRCDVSYSKEAPDIGLHAQFYFNTGFDYEKRAFYEMQEINPKRQKSDPGVAKRLRTLNIFSGCGGLAEGLRQSGVADIVWAVEVDKPTAKAYKLNFPKVVMYERDCNLFLKEVITGKLTDENGNRYPKKGDVEFVCGGPPCQGFSTMNRFSAKDHSQYNNSLILTFLSVCDYYRPKFVLMENVRNFISYKKSLFLKHTLSCLNEMGYQCNFGVIQVGHYGLPQSRKRLFILGAAPGQSLPNFPNPTHVFPGSLKNFEFEVNGTNFCSKFFNVQSGSAPFRNVKIRDAIFDLPPTSQVPKGSFVRREKSFYVKYIWGISSEIQDHVSKEVTPINEARIKHVPASKGCDWRDLPNIRVRLRDETLTDLLKYTHHDKKNGKSCCGLLRGVCSCASSRSCDPNCRQSNTLIPWFLVHTANRNNNWTGLYGRLDWDGVFNTVTTNPEPSSSQGKVLHPEENRIVSVRECARAQGIPDSFNLYGTTADKYRQVGNAVPPPVARAIGYEIKKSLLSWDSGSE